MSLRRQLNFADRAVQSKVSKLLMSITEPSGSHVLFSGTTRSAAVLLPCCCVSNNPGIMFTVRSRQLRSHAGEVSFPGGLFDQAADVSLDQTAVRETIEELPSFSAVRLLGRLPAVPDRSGTIAVHPFVGYVGEFHHRDGVGENKFGRRRQQLFHCDSNGPVQFNPSEVSDCFFLSLEHLLDPKNTIMMQLRRSDSSLMVPSWIGVERQSIAAVENDDTGLDPVNSVQTPDGHLHYRVWGLTAFILSRYLNRVIEPLLGHRC